MGEPQHCLESQQGGLRGSVTEGQQPQKRLSSKVVVVVEVVVVADVVALVVFVGFVVVAVVVKVVVVVVMLEDVVEKDELVVAKVEIVVVVDVKERDGVNSVLVVTVINVSRVLVVIVKKFEVDTVSGVFVVFGDVFIVVVKDEAGVLDASEDNCVNESLTGVAFEPEDKRTIADVAGVLDSSEVCKKEGVTEVACVAAVANAGEDNEVTESLTGVALESDETIAVADEAGVVDTSKDNVDNDSLTGVALESDDN